MAAVFIASFVHNWIGFLIIYSIFFPMGLGMITFIPILCGWEWFPKRRGMVSGVILAGAGLSNCIFDLITTEIANPENYPRDVKIGDNEYFPKIVADRVPGMLRDCVYIWIGLTVISLLTVRRNPEYMKKEDKFLAMKMWEIRDKLEKEIVRLMRAGMQKKADKLSTSMIKNFSILNNAGDVKSVRRQNIKFEERLTRLTKLTGPSVKSQVSHVSLN